MAMAVLWPFASLREAIAAVRATLLADMNVLSRLRLAARAWAAALFHNIPPFEFVAFRLFEAHAPDWNDWLYSPEYLGFARHFTSEQAARICRHKDLFAAFCVEHAVVHLETLALIGPSGFEKCFENNEPPAIDLLVKPVAGQGGRGIEVFHWDGCAFTTTAGTLSPSGLRSHLARRAQAGERLIVQPWLKAHELLAHVSPSTAPAVRLVTARYPDGRVITGPAFLQIPDADAVISNGGRIRLIDTATGEVLPLLGAQQQPIFDGMVPPPQTDAVILPGWHEARLSAMEAHRRFPDRIPVIGWDILFGTAGPVFCEANTSISFYAFQAASGTPANTGPLAGCLSAWLSTCN